MSEDRLPGIPLLLVDPESTRLGYMLGRVLLNGQGELQLVPFPEPPYRLSYGLSVANKSRVLLKAATSDTGLNWVTPILLSDDGDIGVALMALSNFARDAWIRRCAFIPNTSLKDETCGTYPLPVWGEMMFPLDPELNQMTSFRYFVTFPCDDPSLLTDLPDPTLQARGSTAQFERKLFDYRDHAWKELERSAHGKMVTRRNKCVSRPPD